MASVYYVDAYNVLHKSKRLRPLASRDLETAREALIDKVALFCTQTGKRVCVVFDGQSKQLAEKQAHYRGVPSLTVLFSPGHTSADTEIERRVYLERDRLDVVVVSNDQGLRDLCRGMGSLVMEADYFLAEIEDTRSEVMETLQRTQSHRAASIEECLDSGTLARLKALRDKL
ncbi:MAG: NYN domain-containing protein [Candidatus Hydrogenedentes bacterium]|nr:NYN domain-containing protein [Candidatus Hydrogenedentota bacterium]